MYGRTSLTWCGEGDDEASLALVGHLSSDGVMIKMPYGVDVLHQPALHPIFSGQVDFPELPETSEIMEMMENFTKVTKCWTKFKETLTNYIWEKSHVKKQ